MKSNNRIISVGLFFRSDNDQAKVWDKKIRIWLKNNYPAIKIGDRKPTAVLALGGDGAILEAARRYQPSNSLILGLNLGTIGFLASIRDPNKFLLGINEFLQGNYRVTERMMIEAEIVRKRKKIIELTALNEIILQNLIGVSEVEVVVGGHPIQYVRGSGILVATATGSTGYNLSAHGPIVMPSIKCFIINEILDHNLPTPSIVVDASEKIHLNVKHFRKRGLFSLNKKPIDMFLSADGESIVPLLENDRIVIRRSKRLVKFAELESNYFFKSLQEKFAFK
ncbi:MAG: hypothetical protein A3I24_00805 [Candidatus Harrisonbacteria bacterium RIFCSPLOWO2_02_FULL_41_13b]|uniref:NAD kinase n=1 Tax=Candidatus Harrisonbacteria bacterium RIFCSPLOWO2_02_FULL_41_13b TaxID=1798409 RepID=A0A1G1ZUL4_9BACT|nr:MAG: hypothetical protein A3J53_00055 [Candidatus Harrisonbacteria bacterium RIFCSPHIGHO2_02_FULL_40_20]OGY68159.1 MAG: hypothetical protein A3I24_00805 [Candidatus Harrisonbacteria bacterium RIFCSPLOWO2_02_FULL_41_13b]